MGLFVFFIYYLYSLGLVVFIFICIYRNILSLNLNYTLYSICKICLFFICVCIYIKRHKEEN